MGKSQSIREQDVRSMLRLMGEVAQMPADPTLRTQHVLEGVRRMVGARGVFSTRWRSRGRGKGIEPYTILQSGWTEGELASMITIGEHDPFHDRVHDDLLGGDQWPAVYVGARMPVARDPARRESRAQNYEWTGGDIDVAINAPAGQPGHFAGLALSRAKGDRPFSGRDIQIARLLWGELRFLHTKPMAAVNPLLWGTKLPARLEQVLQRLLAGDSAKQVAARLRLSPHTVNDHVKELYRRFGVSSRGELMAEFVRSPAAANVAGAAADPEPTPAAAPPRAPAARRTRT